MKNKTIFICLLSILLLFIFINSNCYAFTFTNDNVDYELELPKDFSTEEHPHFIIIKKTISGNVDYQLLYPESNYSLPFVYYSDNSPYGVRYKITDSTDFGQWKYYNHTTSGAWTHLQTTARYTATTYRDGFQEGYIIYSNTDIYDIDGNIYFKKNYDHSILSKALDDNNPLLVWTPLMKNVVIALLVFLVAFVGFLKAWKWLKAILRGA